MSQTQVAFDTTKVFHDLQFLAQDEELKSAVKACIDAQKRVASERVAGAGFRPVPDALDKVSPEALEKILAEGRNISDIRTDTDLSNCIVFHTTNLAGSLIDDEVLRLRQRADEVVLRRLSALFGEGCKAACSGHFWYPAGGFMGWHTNLRKPGWRMYVNYAEQEGKSFFRYRDPDSGAIVTSMDKEWNFRLFQISPAKPFWHAVYSETNRFSLGYMVAE